ncbi:hypothetical protein [Nitrosophilus kaiyonis]|uniref:hypothetical protein n=1 Tax=Nitrosophilus kaiyonis TaxID=2930200 RepID=UPI00249077AC|nr:hypothetical protein [Nitrosophilus kaiyonis]
MELLPLPNFHHEIFIFLGLLFIITIFYLLKPQKKEKIRLNTKDDIYEFSIRLQKFKDSDEVKELLKELEKYKYSKNPPKLPRDLKKRALKIYKKYNKTNKADYLKNKIIKLFSYLKISTPFR